MDFCRSPTRKHASLKNAVAQYKEQPCGAAVLPREGKAMKKYWILIASVVALVALAVIIPCLQAGETPASGSYQVLGPIRHGNLTIFPVVSSHSHDTSY